MVSWVTVIWSMIAAVCLSLSALYALVWLKNRAAWSTLLFSITAASTAGYAFCELLMMRAETPPQLLGALRWAQLPLFFWLLSLTWFVKVHLQAGRAWLAWTISAMRAIYLVPSFLGHNVNYTDMTSLRHMQFLGESIAIFGDGVRNPLTVFGYFSIVVVLVFVADASVSSWRRGDRRKAVMVGGTIEFFILTGLATSGAVFWGNVQAPLVVSVCYLGMIAVMGYEMSRDVVRSAQLFDELQSKEAELRESEARVSLAVEAGDLGIWAWDLTQNAIWASDSWRALHGFAPQEHLDFEAVMDRVHPDDRGPLRHTHSLALAGADDGNYEMEYRLTLPDGAIRWISSRGRVECNAAGQPVLVRGASREVTARKHAELAVRSLSGRLLSAQEEERRRIARELHDNLSQQIALLAMEIDAVAATPGVSAATVTRSMHELRRRTAEISTELHNLSHRLHSSKLEMLGLAAALRGHCHELQAQGLHAHLHTENVPRTLQKDVELCLFRVAQEALSNVVKHSGVREAHVTLRATDDTVVLSVVDSGRGFDERGATSIQNGLGLASMRERLRLIDGELTIESQPSQGTTVTARVPVPKMNNSITRVG